MDTVKSNNELELTSTMGNVLSTSSKDEKNDTSDATPTSSTDANRTSSASQIVSDDPISSTSSDIVEQNKIKTSEVTMQNSEDVVQATSEESSKSSAPDHEADLLEMSISNIPSERITEDVEDLVHDLESLLGESTDSFNVPIKRKENQKSPDTKETLNTGDQEVLSSGDLGSNKEDDKNEDLDNLQIETDELGNLEYKLEQDFKPDNKIFEGGDNYTTDVEATSKGSGEISEEVPPSSEICTEQKRLASEMPEQLKIDDEISVESAESKDDVKVVDNGSEQKLTDSKVQEEDSGKIEVEIEISKEKSQDISQEEPKEEVESKCSEESEANTSEANVESQQGLNNQNVKEEKLEKTSVIDEESSESTLVSESVQVENTKDDNKCTEGVIENKDDLSNNSEAPDSVNKIENIVVENEKECQVHTEHEDEKSVPPLTGEKVYNISVNEGSSGDHDVELVTEGTIQEVVVNKEQKDSTDIFTESADHSTRGASAPQGSKESLTDCDTQGELIERTKDSLVEVQSDETIKDQTVENLSETDCKETPEESFVVADNTSEVALYTENIGDSTITEGEVSSELECQQIEGETDCETVSNIETTEDIERTNDENDQADKNNEPAVELCDIESKEDIGKMASPKVETPLDNDDKINESQKAIPESTEELIIEAKESESETIEMISVPVASPPSDSIEVTPIETEPMSPVSEGVQETSCDDVIEDDPEGVVSEPESLKKASQKDCSESEVEIVEITEDMEAKTTETQEVVEGVVTEAYEQNVIDVTDIPEIIVNPPEGVEQEIIEDVSIEEIQPQQQYEEIEDTVGTSQEQSKEIEIAADLQEIASEQVSEIVSEQTITDVQEQPLPEGTTIEKPEDLIETSVTSEAEEISTHLDQEITEAVQDMSEENVPTEESSHKLSEPTQDIVESKTEDPKEIEEVSSNTDKLKVDETRDTPKQDELLQEAVTSVIDDSLKMHVENPEVIDDGKKYISEEVGKHQEATNESLDTTESGIPTVETSTPTEEVAKPFNETQKSVIDESVVQTCDIPVDEVSAIIDEPCLSSHDNIEEPSNEIPNYSEETSDIRPEETIIAFDEVTASCDEVSEIIDEIPSSSIEDNINNEIDTSVSSEPTQEVFQIDETAKVDVTNEIIQDQSKDELREVASVEIQIESITSEIEEVDQNIQSKDEIPEVTSAEIPIETVTSEFEDVIDQNNQSKDLVPEVASVEIPIETDTSEFEDIIDQNAEVEIAPESSSSLESEGIEQLTDNNKVIEISDDDSKPMESGGDYVQVLSSGDSDSEEMVPILALEPDENNLSPKEPMTEEPEIERPMIHSMDMASVSEPLPEIEDILADQDQVDEAAASIDMQENLETILAVASLQNADSTEIDSIVEPELSEKERREMEALRKAVESITENSAAELEEVDNVVEELMTDAEIPLGHNLIETVEIREVVTEDIESKEALIISSEEVVMVEDVGDAIEKVEQVESDTDQDVPELRIEDSEDAQEIEESTAVEDAAELEKYSRKEQSPRLLPDTSENVDNETKEVLPDSSQVTLVAEEVRQSEAPKETRNRNNERPRRHKKSVGDNKLEELSINVDVPDKEKPYSPKVIIKPIKAPDDEVSTTSNSDSEVAKGCLKMTITKQSDKMHSILKICDPETLEATQEPDEPIPKLIIKPKIQQVEQQHSPKMSTRSSKQMYSPTSSTQRSSSPRITIKPVVKPDKVESVGPLKIKIKPDDGSKKHNTKVNIKAVMKAEDETSTVQTTRKVIIKPVVKPVDEPEQVHSPRITIKPILKPEPEKECSSTPRLNIKPIKKQDDEELEDKERSSPKIIIKPIVKPQEVDTQSTTEEEEIKERIVLKINKGNLPTPTKDPKKREHPPDDDKSEKLAKITVKFSKGGGHPHIVQQCEEANKRPHEEQVTPEKVKKQKTEVETTISTRSKHKENIVESSVETRSKQKEQSPGHEITRSKHKDVTESPIEPKRAKLKETPEAPIYESTRSRHKEHSISDKAETSFDDPDIKIIEAKLDSPIVISEDSRSQDSGSCIIVEDAKDPLGSIPVFEIRAEPKAMTPKQDSAGSVPSTPSTPSTPTPRKRGRPRKVPLVVREEFKEQEEPKPEPPPKEEEPKPVQESGRPKRSCRGQSVRATLGIKPRKPRGPGRGRGSKRGVGTRAVPMKPESLSK